MALYTNNAEGILTPEQVGALVVQPVEAASVATQVSTVVPTASPDFRIPIVNADATAAWTPEGSDITPSDPDVDELVVTPKKLAALTIISTELANDSSPAATELVGASIARDLARKIDAAYFAATTTNGPAGIAGTNHQVVNQDPAAIADLDPFAEAISLAANEGATVTAFVPSSTTALQLAKLKTGTGSNQPLLQPDATQPTRRQVAGVPLHVVPDAVIPGGDIYAVDTARVFVVIRQDVDLRVDESRYFESDRIGIRATMRVGFGFPHEQAVVRIGNDGS